MKSVTVTKLKNELQNYEHEELVDICLKLAKFKNENKELLTYLLFDSYDENEYIKGIKEEIDEGFSLINQDSLYYVKKSTRKILRSIKKYIRYSKNKETEATLLLCFCTKLKGLRASYYQSQQMINLFEAQLKMAKKSISALHEDIQYDFNQEIEDLLM
jgi:hypothetical protein